MSSPQLRTALLMLASLAIAGCPGDSTGPDENPIAALLTHENGFDFSAGEPDPNFTNNDGDVIVWQPGDSQPNSTEYPNGEYVWWRNDLTNGGMNATVDMGAVELSSVTTPPTAWETPPNITPLLVGHVYVAKCHDGYVKFRVTAVDTQNWTANVEYVYTSGSSF